MINNRQNGRRRGRGGPQARGGAGNGPDRANRIDSRARGNAPQLHEKYRNLARDAQTQGDRVMTEYYLQFADHYFRVVSESRARFEENQPRRQGYDDLEYGDEGDGFDERGGQAPRSEQRADRNDQRADHRNDRGDQRDHAEQRFERPRDGRDDAQRDRQFVPQQQAQPRDEQAFAVEDGEAPRERRGRRPRRDGRVASSEERDAVAEAPERIEIDRLPPAFAPAGEQPAAEAADEEQAPKRRRTRRVAKDDGDSVAA